MRKGICILRNKKGTQRGMVHLLEQPDKSVYFMVYIKNITKGEYTLNIHSNGNDIDPPESLGSRRNIDGSNKNFKNITVDSSREVKVEFITNFARLRGQNSVFGRSLVVNCKVTSFKSRTPKLLWGIIGVNE